MRVDLEVDHMHQLKSASFRASAATLNVNLHAWSLTFDLCILARTWAQTLSRHACIVKVKLKLYKS